MIKDAPINKRKTDLNKKSLEYILENIVGNKIIDVACGRGFLIKKISENKNVGGDIELYGVDIVIPKNLDTKVNLIEANIIKLPFKDGEFDTVVCTHALEHIKNPQKALKEIIRIAKKRIIIVVPCQREYKYTPDLHINFFPYMYTFKKLIGIKEAKYKKIGLDFLCIIDKDKI